MKVYFGSDHHGYRLRPRLVSYVRKLGYDIEDLGPYDDFPDAAGEVVKRARYRGRGVLICGTGQGVTIAANRYPGIRAAMCYTVANAKHAREHLNANVLTLGADNIQYSLAKKIVRTFLSTKFRRKKRYVRRIKQMDNLC